MRTSRASMPTFCQRDRKSLENNIFRYPCQDPRARLAVEGFSRSMALCFVHTKCQTQPDKVKYFPSATAETWSWVTRTRSGVKGASSEQLDRSYDNHSRRTRTSEQWS